MFTNSSISWPIDVHPCSHCLSRAPQRSMSTSLVLSSTSAVIMTSWNFSLTSMDVGGVTMQLTPIFSPGRL